ncbi:MAG TPA: C13 family peptidase, partial [Geobacteraceae bacterium]
MEIPDLNQTPTETSRSAWRCLSRNLRCGVKLALLRRVAPDELCAAPSDLAIVAVADIALNLLLSLLVVGGSGTFSSSALPSFFFHLPLMLLVGLLAGRALSRPALLTAIPVALVALSIPIELCHGALEGLAQLPRLRWLTDYLEAPRYYRFFVWWTAAASLFLVRLAPAPRLRRAAVLFLFLALLATPLWFFPRGDLWVSAAGENESGQLRLTEEVLSAQERLLDEQLAELRPGRKGVTCLYFVGFAGDASQDVFTRELTSVARLFAERFGTAGRTVTLANNPRTATTFPFATATNLGRALERVGQAMNRDDDVLFLFLTSHGSPEHVLDADNPPLELDGLTPEMVRRMLKRSRITWKVIVVSACYAGGFIDPLKDDHTLIITAADATHESFGCQNGEGFTWFGK